MHKWESIGSTITATAEQFAARTYPGGLPGSAKVSRGPMPCESSCQRRYAPMVSGSSRNAVRLPSGTSVQLRRNPHKAYGTQDFVNTLRELGATPHVIQNNTNRRSAIDARTTRHAGYKVSQVKRKRIEEVFGWLKTVGMLRKTRHRGVHKVGWVFTLVAAAYNLVRMRNLVYMSVQSV